MSATKSPYIKQHETRFGYCPNCKKMTTITRDTKECTVCHKVVKQEAGR